MEFGCLIPELQRLKPDGRREEREPGTPESSGSDSKMSLREEGRIDCVADLFTSMRMEQ